MANNPYKAYEKNAVNTAPPEQLTLMLYNGCIRFIQQAIKEVEAKDFEAKNISIQKAQAIIQELMITLDKRIDLAKQMLSLYEYIHFQLQQGNIKNDVQHLEEALTYVKEFRDTWIEVMKQAKKNTYSQGAKV